MSLRTPKNEAQLHRKFSLLDVKAYGNASNSTINCMHVYHLVNQRFSEYIFFMAVVQILRLSNCVDAKVCKMR